MAGLTIQVLPTVDGDKEELDALSASLRRDLLDTDVESVGQLPETDLPEGAKGLASIVGWLAVRLAALDRLRAVVATTRDWAAQNNRTVEITLGGDTLKVTGVSSTQQEKLIDEWLARRDSAA